MSQPQRITRRRRSLLSALDELVEQLRTRFESALTQFDARDIHQARTATRRLKAAMDVFKPVLGKAARGGFPGTLKKIRKHLGDLRDLDVMLEHLTEEKSPRHKRAVEWLTARLTERRDKQRAKTAGKVHLHKLLEQLLDWKTVREELQEATPGLALLLNESLNLQLDDFAADTAQVNRDPHAVRIDAKLLRYTLELTAANHQRLPAGVMGNFKKIQDALGAWHDQAVLAEQCLELSAAHQLMFHDAALQTSVLHYTVTVVKRARLSLDKFKKVWACHRQLITEKLRHAFPMTEPVSDAMLVLPAQVEFPESA